QMDEVADRATRHPQIGQPGQAYPRIVLGFADGAAHQIDQRYGGAPLAARFPAAEHDEVFRVTAFAGGEMVEFEQDVQHRRIFFTPFGLVEDLELFVHHDLAAVRDIQEDRFD